MKIYWYFICANAVLVLSGCTHSNPAASTIEEVMKPIAYKEIVATQGSRNGAVVFYETEHGLDSGFTYKMDGGYRDFCGGGSISLTEMPKVASSYNECVTEDKGNTERFQMFSGALTDADIEELKVQYKAGTRSIEQKAEIIDTGKGYKVWYMIPEETSPYHLDLISLEGYSSEGENIFKD